MQAAIDVLVEFGVPYEVRIVSAHRTPEVMVDYAKQAADRGLEVIIAGAGGAAHLPGHDRVADAAAGDRRAGAARSSSTASTRCCRSCRCPAGIPVATVAVGNAQQRGPARGAHPRHRPTTRCARRWTKYQADLARRSREKDAEVRNAHVLARRPADVTSLSDGRAGCRAWCARSSADGARTQLARRRIAATMPRASDDDDQELGGRGGERLKPSSCRPRRRPAEEQADARARAPCRATR